MNLPKLLTEPGWQAALAEVLASEGFNQLEAFITAELEAGFAVYPPLDQIFFALNQLPPQKVRVVILGQDPYHGPGQAHGLSFSVPKGVPAPPSLKNIFKEIRQSLGRAPSQTNLAPWVAQGVLLLNAVLTVQGSAAGSHQGKGWEAVTDRVIEYLSQMPQPVIFLLWGRFARAKKPLIDLAKNFILEAPHPSPLSAHRGFFGCGHFAQVNQILSQRGETPIQWA
ncbi:MAG: uracil-DNA glycosylase [bacterium]|nr:uracil-DNA glycosylase [bacterium]